MTTASSNDSPADAARAPWEQDHVFGQDRVRSGERRTLVVVLLTLAMMAVEIAAGFAFGSMALLADGLHMASHALALGVAFAAYRYARRHARDRRFSFGTGKVDALAGFAGAMLLGVFAALMVYESTSRLLAPVPVHFDEALLVAVLGLLVNGVSALILGGREAHEHDHGHHRDHNLRSAYLHVIADALTSVLAIFALLGGKYLGASWLDPLMGIVGALLVSRWALSLLRQSARVLLDRQADEGVRSAILARLESASGVRVVDLHVWRIAPAGYAAEVFLSAAAPLEPGEYRALLPAELGLLHVCIEVHRAPPR